MDELQSWFGRLSSGKSRAGGAPVLAGAGHSSTIATT
jgi:hypothetical protein